MVGVSVALGVWILHQAGWLAAWDGAIYDRILSWTIRWREPKPKVLLLRIAREDTWSEAGASKTLDILEGLGARAVVLDAMPQRRSRDFFQRAAALKNVVFGRELRPYPDNPDNLRLESWPPAAREFDLSWGVVFLPPGIRGVHRWQQYSVEVGTNTFPTIEKRAADDPSAANPASDGSFLVNFVGGPGKIPNILLSKALAGELIAEMVRGKVVLIGASEQFPGLATPVSSGAETMTFLEFQGNVLQTLLDGTPIRSLPSGNQIIELIAQHTPPGFLNRIMGVQNIKGTGLDFVYRWQAWQACYNAAQPFRAEKLTLTPQALAPLAAFQDYGVLCTKYMRETIARLKNSEQRPPPQLLEELDKIQSRMESTVEAIQQKIKSGGVKKGGWFTTVLLRIEEFLDAGDAVRRPSQADRIYEDLLTERISRDRAVGELQELTQRQKGGWLLKKFAGRG
jgi:hypothetical protein